MFRCTVFIVSLLTMAATARAQAVQQPVVDVFSVDTVVSVPDRGSMFIGGVRSQAQGRSTAGPLRSGTAWGQASAASSATTRVWIHDFEAMDAALLAEGKGPDPVTVTRADRARAHLASGSATTQFAPSSNPTAHATGAMPSLRRGPVPSAPIPSTGHRPSPRPLTVQPLQYHLIR